MYVHDIDRMSHLTIDYDIIALRDSVLPPHYHTDAVDIPCLYHVVVSLFYPIWAILCRDRGVLTMICPGAVPPRLITMGVI